MAEPAHVRSGKGRVRVRYKIYRGEEGEGGEACESVDVCSVACVSEGFGARGDGTD